MPTKISETVSTGVSQRDFRRLVTIRDQHKCARFPDGRPWHGYVERASDPDKPANFVQELLPGDHEDPFGSGWESPWYPDQRFKRVDVQKGRVDWQYGDLVNDLERARREYYAKVTEVGYEKGWPVPEYGAPMDHRYRSIVGPLPESPKMASAALAGDPYILGFTPHCDDDGLRVALAAKTAKYVAVPQPDVSDSSDSLTVKKGDLAQMIQDGIEAALHKKAQERMANARAAKKAA